MDALEDGRDLGPRALGLDVVQVEARVGSEVFRARVLLSQVARTVATPARRGGPVPESRRMR
jgi:hypothetical protein